MIFISISFAERFVMLLVRGWGTFGLFFVMCDAVTLFTQRIKMFNRKVHVRARARLRMSARVCVI